MAGARWMLLALAAWPAVSHARRDAAPVCVLRAAVEGPEAQEDGTILFRGRTGKDQSWMGRFKGGRCPMMTSFSAVLVEQGSNRYCEGDIVRAVNSPAQGPGPRCAIDTLSPVPADR